MWHSNIRDLLNKQKVLETLTNNLEKPSDGDIEQYRHGLETFKIESRRIVSFYDSRSMWNDLIGQFKVHALGKDMWDALRPVFTTISTASLCQLSDAFRFI